MGFYIGRGGGSGDDEGMEKLEYAKQQPKRSDLGLLVLIVTHTVLFFGGIVMGFYLRAFRL